MVPAVVTYLAVLLLAGCVLIWEARTGRLTGKTARRDALRAGLFFLAAVVGGALLVRSAGSTVLLALAFIPVTVLSLMRLVMIARRRWSPVATAAVLGLALLTGMSGSLSLLPQDLDRTFFIEQVFHRDAGPAAPSIDPAARHSVRT